MRRRSGLGNPALEQKASKGAGKRSVGIGLSGQQTDQRGVVKVELSLVKAGASLKLERSRETPTLVMPAQAGIQCSDWLCHEALLDPGLRRGDDAS